MKKITTFLLCSMLLIITTSATKAPGILNSTTHNKTLNFSPLKASMFVDVYDVAYHAAWNGSGYEVTLYFLAVTGASYTTAPAPVDITVTGSIGSYSGSVIIPQGQSTYFLGTFPSISGGITSVSPTSIGGIPVYHQQPPGW